MSDNNLFHLFAGEQYDVVARDQLIDALHHLEKKEFEEAKNCLLEALRYRPNHNETKYYLALVHYFIGEFDESLALMKELSESEPYVADYLFGHGVLLVSKKRVHEALVLFLQAQKERPYHIDTLFYLGKCYGEIGIQYELALTYLEEVIEMNAGYGEAYIEKARIQSKQFQYEEALGTIRSVCQMNDIYVGAYYLHTHICCKVGYFQEARVFLLELLEREPSEKNEIDKKLNVIRTLESL